MKKLISCLLISFICTLCFAQNQQANLQKYWNYRDRLSKKFIVVSRDVLEQGVNIPASDLFVDESRLSWGDGNNNMGHYLGMLATELWLLKKNNQDYSETLKELYYAMLAMERLDAFTEPMYTWYRANGYKWIEKDNKDFSPSKTITNNFINGFAIRNDVTASFWDKYKSQLGVDKFTSNFSDDNTNHKLEENSQDVIFHTIFGLALVAKLVGTESVDNISCADFGIGVKSYLFDKEIITSNDDFYRRPTEANFSLWAKDIIKRYIVYMQTGGSISMHFSAFYELLGVTLLDWDTDFMTTHWVLFNRTTTNLVQEGSGDNFGTDFLSSGTLKLGQNITGEDLKKYDSAFGEGAYNIAFESPYLMDDQDLLYTVSATGNYYDDNTFSYLKLARDNYDPHHTGHTPVCVYEHLPLINLALYDTDNHILKINDTEYNTDKQIYKNLLNIAPENGPASNCDVYEWSITSRLLWPQKCGTQPTKHIEYNGLDYMLLHNLYYIAFRKEDLIKCSIDNSSASIQNRTNSINAGVIESSAPIIGQSVTYHATQGITLKNGFSASSTQGKTFKATVSRIVEDYKCEDYRMLSSTFGSAPSGVKSASYSIDDSKATDNEPSNMKFELSFYPNPAHNDIAISTNGTSLPLPFEIIDMKGVVVFKEKIVTSSQHFDVSTLSRGIYFIRFLTEQTCMNRKLVLK